MRRSIRLTLGIVLVTVCVATGALALAQSLEEPTAGPRTWVDRPLDGTVITGGPVAVTAHIAHPSGVDGVRLVVDGYEVLTDVLSGEPFVTVEMTWTPEDNGLHHLAVSGSAQGLWGTPADVVVVVSDPGLPGPPGEDTTTTSPPPGSTSSSTSSSSTSTTSAPTTTEPPCDAGAPSVTGPTGTITDPTPDISWSYEGCEPLSFTIEIAGDEEMTDIEFVGSEGGIERTWTAPELEVCKRYWVRVTAVFGGRVNAYSTVVFFDLAGHVC